MNLEDIFADYPDVVNVKQLCEMLQIGKTTAYEMLKRGDIQSFKQGEKHKIPKLYVIDYIRKMLQEKR